MRNPHCPYYLTNGYSLFRIRWTLSLFKPVSNTKANTAKILFWFFTIPLAVLPFKCSQGSNLVGHFLNHHTGTADRVHSL